MAFHVAPFQTSRRLACPAVPMLEHGAALLDAARKIITLRLDRAANDGIRRERHGGKRAPPATSPIRMRRIWRKSAACPACCSHILMAAISGCAVAERPIW